MSHEVWSGFFFAASLVGGVVAAGCDARVSETPAAAVGAGEQAVQRRGCAACHDPGDGSLSGQKMALAGSSTYGSNLTPDRETGLGHWSDDDIIQAMRVGRGDDGQPLCWTMPRYGEMTSSEASNIVAYLRSLSAVSTPDAPESQCGGAVDASVLADLGAEADSGGLADMSLPGDLSTPVDLAARDLSSLRDLSTPMDLASPRDLSSPPDLAAAGPPRINEVQTGGATRVDDEFVEIWNGGGAPVSLHGWRLVYRSDRGDSDVTLLDLDGNIGARAYLVVAGKGFGGIAARYAGALAASGGGLALRDAHGAIVDSVGWGTANNTFVRGAAATAPSPGQSLARRPNGTDSGNNASDFLVSTPTPGAAN